jgi:hypothetical protein
MHEITAVAANIVENFEDDLAVITGYSASKPVRPWSLHPTLHL